MNENEDVTNYEQTALILKEKSDALIVSDAKSAQIAESIEMTAKDNAKMLTEHMEPAIKEAHARHKTLTTLRDRLVTPFKVVADSARQKRIAWTQDEQRKAQEAMRKAEQEARKAAEEALLAEAAACEKAGDKEQATAILEAPVAPVFVPVIEAPKVKGARELWSCDIVDAKALLRALPDSPFMPDLTADELGKLATLLKLSKHAVSLKSNFRLAGVRTYSKVV